MGSILVYYSNSIKFFQNTVISLHEKKEEKSKIANSVDNSSAKTVEEKALALASEQWEARSKFSNNGKNQQKQQKEPQQNQENENLKQQLAWLQPWLQPCLPRSQQGVISLNITNATFDDVLHKALRLEPFGKVSKLFPQGQTGELRFGFIIATEKLNTKHFLKLLVQ